MFNSGANTTFCTVSEPPASPQSSNGFLEPTMEEFTRKMTNTESEDEHFTATVVNCSQPESSPVALVNSETSSTSITGVRSPDPVSVSKKQRRSKFKTRSRLGTKKRPAPVRPVDVPDDPSALDELLLSFVKSDADRNSARMNSSRDAAFAFESEVDNAQPTESTAYDLLTDDLQALFHASRPVPVLNHDSVSVYC